MIDKNKLIDVMKFAHQDCLCNYSGTVEEAWEAALIALCKELPEREMRKNYGPYLRGTAEIYDQLKDIGK